MNLKIQHFVIFITIIICSSCKDQKSQLTEIEGKQLSITDSIAAVDSVQAFIEPYRLRVNTVLDSTLAYAPHTISKTDGAYNTTAGNLMADIILERANKVFKLRTGKEVDFVVLNHGGIRSIISKGKVSARTAYQVMPFENNIVVVAMKGKAVRDLISFLINSGRAHPIAGLRIVMDKNKRLQSADIQGKPFDENRIYHVATSDYLVSGGDNMGFFKEAEEVTEIDYLIRNAIIDHFKDNDTIAPLVDDRFIQTD